MRLIIINLQSSVDINPLFLVTRLIENLSLEGIGKVMCDIIVGECDDAIGIESSLDQHLISVIDIGLVAVIGPSVRTCH